MKKVRGGEPSCGEVENDEDAGGNREKKRFMNHNRRWKKNPRPEVLASLRKNPKNKGPPSGGNFGSPIVENNRD